MIKIVTPDSSPEEIQEFCTQLKGLAEFLNSNEQAKQLLADAGAGHITEEECLVGLLSVTDEA